MSSSSDFLVIGAGSAGCVLANRLSEGATVTLLEAGPSDYYWDFRIHMPAALSHVLSNDTYNWYYYSEPEPGLNNRAMYCPRGRVLGGSSSINGMIFVRGNPQDFDDWSTDPELADWSYEHCLPYFQKSETCLHGAPDYRGSTGPLTISRGAATGELHQAWLQAGVQAGYASTGDFNGEQQEGFGVYDRTVRKGRRLSAARAYLHPVMQRQNLNVVSRAQVSRILLEQGRAVGVEYQKGGQFHRHFAGEVILSGGAINSPQLLMLSGIGPAAHLREQSIEVQQDLPGVGQNLQDHLEIYVQFSCKRPVSIFPALKWYRQPWIGLEWYMKGTGMGATNHFETGAFLRSSSAVNSPDLQFHFLPVAMNYDGSSFHNGHGFQAHVGPMKPTSRGHVRLRTGRPDQAPLIQFNYNSTEADRQVMKLGIEKVREIVQQSAFDELRGAELQPGNQDLDEFIRNHAESAYHPSGSCRMGSGPEAVTDGQGRVYGMQNLRVVDASLMPTVTNGNLNAPVIMMAEKISDAILA